MILPDANLLLFAYHPRASQHEASKEWLKTRPASRNLGQSFLARACLSGFVSFVFQNSGDQSPDIFFIIDDQNIVRHVVTNMPVSKYC